LEADGGPTQIFPEVLEADLDVSHLAPRAVHIVLEGDIKAAVVLDLL
jgi:hypothetical protein|tara:strand:- start:529 stop:669 length:141 start_codon:yes stop_codon:yes gene_type:complete